MVILTFWPTITDSVTLANPIKILNLLFAARAYILPRRLKEVAIIDN